MWRVGSHAFAQKLANSVFFMGPRWWEEVSGIEGVKPDVAVLLAKLGSCHVKESGEECHCLGIGSPSLEFSHYWLAVCCFDIYLRSPYAGLLIYHYQKNIGDGCYNWMGYDQLDLFWATVWTMRWPVAILWDIQVIYRGCRGHCLLVPPQSKSDQVGTLRRWEPCSNSLAPWHKPCKWLLTKLAL